jgi:GxxExxY protein
MDEFKTFIPKEALLTQRIKNFKYQALTDKIIAAAIEVHRALGPGLLESTYEACLAKEFSDRGLVFQCQLSLPVFYKGDKIECGYRVDMLVENKVILELKNVESLLPIHEAQLLTYMKLAKIQVGLLINFNSTKLVSGIKRFAL